MFGWYTPVFRAMYELMPGVKLFRRPADATFVFGALIAIMTGYLVHRWLDRCRTRDRAAARHRDSASAPSFSAPRSGSPTTTVGLAPALKPIVTGLCLSSRVAVLVLIVARRLAAGAPVAAMLLLVVFTTADLAWNNAPHESTGLPPARLRRAARRHAERDRRADQAAPRARSSRTIATASS